MIGIAVGVYGFDRVMLHNEQLQQEGFFIVVRMWIISCLMLWETWRMTQGRIISML